MAQRAHDNTALPYTREGAKFGMSVLTNLKSRGARDIFFLVCRS